MSGPSFAELAAFIDGLGLRHFDGEELRPHFNRVADGVPSTLPPRSLWPNIVPTLVVLDEARARAGVIVLAWGWRGGSSYRSIAYNAAVGGPPGSQHTKFRALDVNPMHCKTPKLAEVLRGTDARYEAITFRLANGHRYTPDWVVFESGRPSQCHEVKGSYKFGSHQRARLAFDQAATEFPGLNWFWATLTKKGWEQKHA
jgi:hypothetical protein